MDENEARRIREEIRLKESGIKPKQTGKHAKNYTPPKKRNRKKR